MRTRKQAALAAAYTFCALLPACAEQRPVREISTFIEATQNLKPWHIDLVEMPNVRDRWYVDAYYQLHQIGPNVCASMRATFQISHQASQYTIVSRDINNKAISLANCSTAATDIRLFSSIWPNLSDDDLLRAIQAMRSVLLDAPDQVKYKTPDLRKSFREVMKSDSALRTVYGNKEGDIIFVFRSDRLYPNELAVEIGASPEPTISVYQTNGPEVQ